MVSLEDVFGERLNVTVLRLLSTIQGGMSGNGVARRLGLHQSAARKALERLADRGIVTRTGLGRSTAYELDTRREFVRRLVVPVFRAEAALGERLRRAVHRAVNKVRPVPAAIVLYGSVARGERTPGDIDVLIVLQHEADAEPVRSTLLDAVRPIEVRFALAVNPVLLTVAELRARSDDPLVHAVAKDGVLLAGNAPPPLRRIRRFEPPVRVRAEGGAAGAPHRGIA